MAQITLKFFVPTVIYLSILRCRIISLDQYYPNHTFNIFVLQVRVNDVGVFGIAVGGEILGDPLLPQPQLLLTVAQRIHRNLNLVKIFS